MVDFNRKIQYKIIFKEKVDMINIISSKNNIDLTKLFDRYENKFVSETNQFVIVDLTKDERFIKSKFNEKYKFHNNCNYYNFSLLEINNSPNKYEYLKKLYLKIEKNKKTNCGYDYYLFQLKEMSYEEFEYEIDLMLEEFKLFLDKFEFDDIENIIINILSNDEKIKSKIIFIGWIDYKSEFDSFNQLI